MTEDNNDPMTVEALCREATKCRTCFDHNAVNAPMIDIAQPRWIGDGYWASSPRICVMMPHPSVGNDHNVSANVRMQSLLQRFSSDEARLDDVFRLQRADFQNWGNPTGRFLNFFRNFGLDIDRIALANVAWCATVNNRHPRHMLDTCMGRWTGRLVSLLEPDVVMLSGSKTHVYGDQVSHLTPRACIFRTLHFAHRKGDAEEAIEAQRFRDFLVAI